MQEMDAEVAAYIGRWRPSSVSPRAAAFARDVITQAGPQGRERAKNLLWAAGQARDRNATVILNPESFEPRFRLPRPSVREGST